MNYLIQFDIAGILIITIILACHYIKRTIVTPSSQAFESFVWIAFGSIFFDLVSVYGIENPYSISLTVNTLISILYMICNTGMAASSTYYISLLVKDGRGLSRTEKLLMFIPAGAVNILILSQFFNSLVFGFDANRQYYHGPLMFVLYVVSLYYLVFALIETMARKFVLPKRYRYTVIIYSAITIVTVIVQLIRSELLITGFAAALGILVIFISIESPENYVEASLGCFNKAALTARLKALIARDKKYELLAVQISGFEYITDVLGLEAATRLRRMLTEFIVSAAGKNGVYLMGENQYVIVGSRIGVNWHVIEKTFNRYFSNNIHFEGLDIKLDKVMCLLRQKPGSELSRPEDVERVILLGLEYAENNAIKDILEADDNMLSVSRRELEILHIMRQALKEDRFSVYYQPIYSVEKKRYTSAEALVRLIDDTIGFISPEEFIPIAEKNGLVKEIGDFVFRDVCRFMSQERIWERGIDYIDVNLSAVQCMQETLYQQLFDIMDKYRLPYHCINLEITETAAVVSDDVLRANMKRLQDKGVKFSLDDYGTGYANTASIIDYPFYTIKIDKTMLWNSEKSVKAMLALKHTVAMIKDMNMEIICEGVETAKQFRDLKEMGCEYLQGYYFSKPLDEKSFLEKLAEGYIEVGL